MPTDLETQALVERDMLDRLTAEFVSLPRSLRRRISRDTARHYARLGDRNGKCADRIRPRKPKQFSGFMDAMAVGDNIPASGQRRINAKRNARAEFWRTVRIRVSVDLDEAFRSSLHLLGRGTRILGATPNPWGFVIDYAVHIPGAPGEAKWAHPIYRRVVRPDAKGHHRLTVELNGIDWYDANQQRIETDDRPLINH